MSSDESSGLVCPWCRREAEVVVVSGTLKLNCKRCKMNLFVVKLPQGEVLSNYMSRRTIS
ncbi:MAG: hypothetical protein ACXAC7_03030 [Candidatus Hodarchaeales archaeon]|jgi:hypothetical protein